MRCARWGLLIAGIVAGGCAGRAHPPASAITAARDPSATISGVWDGVVRETITEGVSAGDIRVEKQKWHLDQKGPRISGYYLAALTFTSGDGRPYVCSRQATFSATIRFDVSGLVQNGGIVLDEITQQASDGRCSPGARSLAHYRAEVHGNELTLITADQRQTLYRGQPDPTTPGPLITASATAGGDEPMLPTSREGAPHSGSPPGVPADVSGVWIWEHRGAIPTGDEKQEREEWHVDQDGARLTGYYDRVVREISNDGHAFKCSMDLEFQIATRYKFRGEVRGNQLIIYESSYEVLEPSACDNGQRRLDAYEGLASGDEVRLIWGVGGQVLRRPRPDVPTQRF
jgi:hypothetical protein